MSRPRLLVWSYDPGLPSFRHRLAPLAAELGAAGWEVEVDRIPKGRYLRRIDERRGAVEAADLVVLGKINLAFGEGRRLRGLARRLVLDFDDAIYLRKPRRPGRPPGDSWVRRAKFARTCAVCDLVLAGNAELAAAAAPTARRVEVVPTPVDAAAYPERVAGRAGRTLVWIGLPENLPYLQPLRPVLAGLAAEHPEMRLRIVSSAFPDWPEVPIERVVWSERGEVEAVATAGIGLMPLTDDGWSRGKCAFKLLQYMAAGLPAVASPVGANRDAVVDGDTGLLASTPAEWAAALGSLLADPARCAAMGAAGRRRIFERYDRAVVVPRAAALLAALATG
jgi:glycosyltransferase involved in cell wall biosynthesis